MLCDGSATYRNLYDSSQLAVTKKSIEKSSTLALALKSSLTLGLNSNYRAGCEITAYDSEKKTVNYPLLVTDWSLNATANKGVIFYCKALVYATTKWDLKKNEPKESGTSSANVIEFECREIYKEIYDIGIDESDYNKEHDYNEVGDRSEEKL